MTKIKTKAVFYTHTIAVSALFILGQFIITLPFISGFYSLLGYLLSAVAGVLICLICVPLTEKIVTGKIAFLKGIILFSICVLAAFTLAETFKIFCRFVCDVLLDSASLFFSVVLFGGVCIYFAFRRQEDILKFSLLSFIYSIAVIIIFTLLLLPNLKAENIILPENFSLSRLIDGTKKQFFSIYVPAVLLGFYQYAVFGKTQKSAVLGGVTIGALVLSVCLFSCVLLFGAEFSAVLDFPYSAAVSSISVGRLFSRLDALLYFVFLVCCLVKIQVCIFTVRFCLKKIKVTT